MIMAKTVSAFLSAITLSAIMTFNRVNVPEHESFGFVFFTGSMVLAAFYLLVGIPLSVMAERIAPRSRRRLAARTGLHAVLGVGFGLLFLLVREWRHGIGIGPDGHLFLALLLFGAAGALFAVYEYFMDRMINLMKR